MEKKVLNPFTAKIWLLILPSSCDSLPCILVTSGSYRVNIWNFKAAADNLVDVSDHWNTPAHGSIILLSCNLVDLDQLLQGTNFQGPTTVTLFWFYFICYLNATNFCIILKSLPQLMFNPLTPRSDQDRISPYSINTISTR